MNILNFRQLQYAVMLSETGSFSQLAEKLNITQPALSKHILSLEKELGIQLFNRSIAKITPTAAGEFFLREAKEILYKEDQLIRSMEQFKSGDKGQLVIGITPFRSSYLIPKIVKKLQIEFPGIQVKLIEEGTELLRKDAADGKFDFAIVNLPVDETMLDVTFIEPDRLVLVVPNEIINNYSVLKGKTEIDFKDCKDLPFVVVGQGQEMRILFDKLCISNNIKPEIAAEVVGLTTAWEMASSGVAATLLPLQFVNSDSSKREISVIKLKNDVYLRQPAVVVKKGQYLSKYAKYAIELLTCK